MEPKRILLISDLWDTHPNGPATATRNLKRELESRGITVDLIEPGQFFTVPFPLYPEVALPLFARGSVRRAILNGKYDEIHLMTEGLLGWFARGLCKKRGLVFTSSLHGRLDLYAETWLGKWAGTLVRHLLLSFHSADSITLVLTKEMEDQAHTLGILRTRVWPLGVDPLFSEKGMCPATLEKPVFMYFGRLSSEKNVEEFLKLELPGTKLVIGGGPDLKKYTKSYPTARFVGYKVGKPLVDWLSCVDVFVMPSRTDIFPQVVVESLAAGIPVAAHDVTGPHEFVQSGVNGYLSEDLKDAAMRCLTLSREACRDSVQKYSWRASADRFLSILKEAREVATRSSGTSG